MIGPVAACLLLVAGIPAAAPGPAPATRFADCLRISFEARRQGVPFDVAVSLAWNESRLDATVVGAAGEIGALQVIPRWHCPHGRAQGCDPVAEGVRFLGECLDRYRTIVSAICHYNAGPGPCPRRALAWGRTVARTLAQVRPVVVLAEALAPVSPGIEVADVAFGLSRAAW